jgi:hypothetical protein
MAKLSTSTATHRQPSAADLNRLIERRREAFHGYEPWVRCEVAAEYIDVHPKTLEKMAREDAVPAHPVCIGRRNSWRFLISELDAWMRSRVSSHRHPCSPNGKDSK